MFLLHVFVVWRQAASVTFDQLGMQGSQCTMRDLWARQPVVDAEKSKVEFVFPLHVGEGNYGSGLFALSGCR